MLKGKQGVKSKKAENKEHRKTTITLFSFFRKKNLLFLEINASLHAWNEFNRKFSTVSRLALDSKNFVSNSQTDTHHFLTNIANLLSNSKK